MKSRPVKKSTKPTPPKLPDPQILNTGSLTVPAPEFKSKFCECHGCENGWRCDYEERGSRHYW